MARDYVDVTRLIRSIQRAEGNPDCFRRIMNGCQEDGCWWRPYCIEEPRVTGSADKTMENQVVWLNDSGLKNGFSPACRSTGGNRP